MISEKEQLKKYIEEINKEIKVLYDMQRAKCIKLAMLEAHDRFDDDNDYHNFIHQRIDDLMGEIKWQR